MPTLIFLAIAFQIQNINWRRFFLLVAAANFIFNIYHHSVIKDFYSAVLVMLLFMLTPYFLSWWDKRNSRNNPVSFLQFVEQTLLISKHHLLKLIGWIIFLVVSIALVCWYTGYTGYVLLGWLLAVFLLLFSLKNIFHLMLPPEWFLHDDSTRYVYLSILIGWAGSWLIYQKIGVNFMIPMVFTVIFSFIWLCFARNTHRYLISGSVIILADIAWQIVRFVQSGTGNTPQVIVTECVLIAAMLYGLIWLLRKPGLLPLIYLALFQLFRFSGFTYQAIDRISHNELSAEEVTYYMIYLVCWMYLVPLLFLFIGLQQQKPVEVKRDNRRLEKMTAKLMKYSKK